MRSLTFPLALIFLLTPLAAAAAASPSPAATSSFGESINVEVVNVEVFVSDSQGRPVRGLGRDDFKLFVDGKERKIVNFYEAKAASEPAERMAPAKASTSRTVAERPPETRRLTLAVYLDDRSLHPFSRKRVLDQLGPFLESRLRAGDRLLLVTFDHQIHVRNTFYDPKRPIGVEIAALGKLATSGVAGEMNRSRTLDQIREDYRDLGCGRGLHEMLNSAGMYERTVRAEVRDSLRGLRRFVTNLAGLRGAKAVLYVSDGLALDPGLEAYRLVEQYCGERHRFGSVTDVEADLRRVTAAANAAGVTLYTLQASGIQGRGASAEDMGRGLSPGDQSAVIYNHQDILSDLARETGGWSVLASNRIAPALAHLERDVSSYYSLGFNPAHPGDGKEHDIDVKVRGKGLTVRHRTTYLATPALARSVASIQSDLLVGAGTNKMGLTLEIGEARRQESGSFVLPVRLRLPVDKLSLVPGSSASAPSKAEVKIFVAAADHNQNVSPVRVFDLPLEVPRAELGRKPPHTYPFGVQLQLGAGSSTIMIGAEDELTHAISVTHTTVTLPATDKPSSN